MGQRADERAPGRPHARLLRAIARHAAVVSGAPLVAVLLERPDGPPRFACAACDGPGLDRPRQSELGKLVEADPAIQGLEPAGRKRHLVARCDPALGRALGAGARPGLRAALLPVGAAAPAAWIAFMGPGSPGRAALRVYRAVARQAAHEIQARARRGELARDVTRERRALAELQEAKETLAALGLAGAHLMVETDQRAVYGVICRELIRLGFHTAVLEAERGHGPPRAPFRYAFTSFGPQLQSATERLLGRSLAAIRLDPASAPLLRRVLETGRMVRTDRPLEVGRELFGNAPEDPVRKFVRLLQLRHVLLAPLRYAQGISGVLVVTASRLRRSDPEAIDVFALQASIALEKARLFAQLRQQQAVLESEVDRRTRELTLAVRALQELDRRKDNFLANVSHELRTPLVTVLGYADLVLSEKIGELNERQRDCLRTAVGSARRLRSFIDELLEFSRHELTKEGLAFEPLDVPDLLQQAARSLAPQLHQAGVSLRRRVAPGTPRAWGDRDRLLQVLTNLIGNAEKYAGQGGRIRLAAAGTRPGRVDISVSDDGPGIAPEHLERIFDRLYQVGDARRPRDQGQGLGLGLAIARAIVEAHGGTISARSRLGSGTSFRFSIPTAPALEAGAAVPAAAAASTPS
ncbi:MAG TPA: HAMP domain-containing sensor histidine kinase [Anaeromyxobacteraceae bacterium]